MKMDSPAVYTKPGGGEYKHSPCWKKGDLQVVTGETLINLCLCVLFIPNILQRETGYGLGLSD